VFLDLQNDHALADRVNDGVVRPADPLLQSTKRKGVEPRLIRRRPLRLQPTTPNGTTLREDTTAALRGGS